MKKALFFLLLFFCSQSVYTQSNINPDISLIGTFNTSTNFVKGSPEYGKLNFESPEMELYIDGYLNPFARATANIAYEEDEFSVEELYANIVRGLPLDMQIKAGKYLVGFGKINTQHPHAWPFLNRPLFHQVFFGMEGFNEVGASINFLLPTENFYSNLEVGLYKGESIPGLTDTNSVERGINPIFVGRLSSFIDISDYSNIEVGLSGAYGCYSKAQLNTAGNSNSEMEEKPLNYIYGGIDFKFKYSPDTYSAFILQGEALLNNRDVVREGTSGIDRYKDELQKITTFGAFIYADYRFEKQFSVGAKYDFTAGIVDDEPAFYTLANDDKNSTQGVEGWVSYYPVEETIMLRFGVQHLSFNYKDNTQRDGETTLKLQLLFSLGPHKAHQF